MQNEDKGDDGPWCAAKEDHLRKMAKHERGPGDLREVPSGNPLFLMAK